MPESQPIAEAEIKALAAELASALAYAEEHRLGLKITRVNDKFAVTMSPRSKRARSADTIKEALAREQSLRVGGPLPEGLVWDGASLAEQFLQLSAPGNRIFFEADFRKTGQGKVFSCRLLMQPAPGIKVSLEKVMGNNATAVLGQAWHEIQAPLPPLPPLPDGGLPSA